MGRHWLGFLVVFSFLLCGVFTVLDWQLASRTAAGWFALLLVAFVLRGVFRLTEGLSRYLQR